MPDPLLSVRNLRAGQGAFKILDGIDLDGIDLDVAPGEIVAVLGANGNGKTTLNRAFSGIIPRTGTITFAGQSIAIATRALVIENPRVVPSGPATDLANDSRLRTAYLGVPG